MKKNQLGYKKRNRMIKRIIPVFLLFGGFTSQAQQDPQYTQYMYNTVNINPAYAGSRGAMSILGSYRMQWLGAEGAPQTGALSIHTPFEDSKIGLGIGVSNDRIGATNENIAQIDLSYSLFLDEKGQQKLSFGLKGVATMTQVDYGALRRENPNDALLNQRLESRITPNIGAGLYYHSQKAYLGFSVPRILEQNRLSGDSQYHYLSQKPNYYLIGGYVFDLNSVLKFKPSFLLKATQGAPYQLDLSGNFLLYDKLTVGGAYRLDSEWSAMLGFQITDGLFMGYSYDHNIRSFSDKQSGSHELILRFDLYKRHSGVKTPRFF